MTNLADVPTGFVLHSAEVPWTRIGRVEDVPCDRGIAVLVDDGAIAVFRLSAAGGQDEAWFAVSHNDPSSGAAVMARGLVGSSSIETDSGTTNVVCTVASPLDKRRYDLASGRCLDGDFPALATCEIMIVDGQVLVR